MAAEDQGYDEGRFEGDVNQNFLCPICLNVLKDPVQCQKNQHYFCTPCIMRHLRQTHTCPKCMEELTPEMVKQPPRIVTDYLSELKIRCDYAERGCPEFVALELLRNHAADCGFRPVQCSNDGCTAVINKRDKERHETRECNARVEAACEGCNETRELDFLKESLTETKNQLQYALHKFQGETKRELDQMKKNVGEMKTQLENMRGSQETIRLQLFAFMAEMRDEVKRLTARLPSLELVLVNRRDIIVILGGFKDTSGKPVNTVEIFNFSKRHWQPLNPMLNRRAEAWSVVQRNQLIIAGGWTSENATSTMETLNANQLGNAQWKYFPRQMPFESFSHRCLVYEDKMILIGGWNPTERKCLDSIHEVLLDPPYAARLVSNMPEPRCLHSAQVIGNKLFILGGTTSQSSNDAVSTVLMYDINNYTKPQQLTPLPFAICSMAAVAWKDKIILLGGSDSSEQALDTVLMYSTKTGESNFLPRMKYCRRGCSAVVLENMIVVMGGMNEKHQVLNSVEYYDFGRCSWEELAPMIEPRTSATAAVLFV